jgi:ectoine hydroxylase-related dioxygenase (phytanoyl-CoA dioxygenase family)
MMSEIDEYAKNGHVVCRAALDPGALRHLRSAVEELWGLQRAGRVTVAQFDVREKLPMVMEIMTLRPLLELCRKMLGGRDIRLWQEQVIIKPPLTGGETGWHQDFPFWPMRTPSAITCWIPLQDVDLITGCLRFFSGSHKWDTGATVLPRTTEDIQRLARATGEHDGVVPIADQPMRIGDCSFHHGLVFHGASANSSTAYRVAFKVVYMVDGTLYREQSHTLTLNGGLRDGDPIAGASFPILR